MSYDCNAMLRPGEPERILRESEKQNSLLAQTLPKRRSKRRRDEFREKQSRRLRAIRENHDPMARKIRGFSKNPVTTSS